MILDGNGAKGDRNTHIVKAGKLMSLTVRISSSQDSAFFWIKGPGCGFAHGINKVDETKASSGMLLQTDDYSITVKGTEGDLSQKLTVKLSEE